MSPNEREWGTITTKLEQLAHKQRNMRMMLDAIQEDQHELRAEIAKLRVTLRTALAVLGVIVAGFAWVVELVMP
jgi:chromosome segregation ATPase